MFKLACLVSVATTVKVVLCFCKDASVRNNNREVTAIVACVIAITNVLPSVAPMEQHVLSSAASRNLSVEPHVLSTVPRPPPPTTLLAEPHVLSTIPPPNNSRQANKTVLAEPHVLSVPVARKSPPPRERALFPPAPAPAIWQLSVTCKECQDSNGHCGYNNTRKEVLCFCKDGSVTSNICEGISRTRLSKLIIGLITGGTGALLIICIIICIFRHKFWETKKNDQDIEAFIRNNGHLVIKRYSYSNVKKMTSSFEFKLGEGGYGKVYKGVLNNGGLVAVKLLNASKGNGQEFINEVLSISRTSHVNIVALLGFCLEGRKKALIYEFMPNGSLDKFINNNNNNNHETCNPVLSWEMLHQIAQGVAKGLEYLHRGCNTKILHLDIKPNNILLDEKFRPKIADFGLAKLCSRTHSVVSMLDARGTIGYIAPEVWNRNVGGVSHKSDVYSYGMMILEMMGEKHNTNNEVTHSSELYFPHWIYKHIEGDENIAWRGAITSEENEIVKKMIIVGLWCIQTMPSDRPPMSRVIEMLEGSIDQLKIPPKPFIFSPTINNAESCTIGSSD